MPSERPAKENIFKKRGHESERGGKDSNFTFYTSTKFGSGYFASGSNLGSVVLDL